MQQIRDIGDKPLEVELEKKYLWSQNIAFKQGKQALLKLVQMTKIADHQPKRVKSVDNERLTIKLQFRLTEDVAL